MIKAKQIGTKEQVVIGTVDGYLRMEQCNNDYRVYVTRDEGGKLIVGIEQQYDSGEWGGTGGCWFLSTLLEGGVNNRLFMDYGQNWYVIGMKEMIEKIVEEYV